MTLDSGIKAAIRPHVPENFAPHERIITEPEPAKGRFLVATPGLEGSIFEKSVILLIDYSLAGANGLIINKPGSATAADVFPDIKELADRKGNIYLAGPVQIGHVYLLVQSDNRPSASEEILHNLYFSASIDTMKETASRKEEGLKFRLYFGYSGWSHGQLVQEILRGSWYVMEGEPDVVFSEKPSMIWQNLIRKRTQFHDTVLRKPDDDIPVSGL